MDDLSRSILLITIAIIAVAALILYFFTYFMAKSKERHNSTKQLRALKFDSLNYIIIETFSFTILFYGSLHLALASYWAYKYIPQESLVNVLLVVAYLIFAVKSFFLTNYLFGKPVGPNEVSKRAVLLFVFLMLPFLILLT